MIKHLIIVLSGLTFLTFSLRHASADEERVQQFVIPFQVETTDQIHFYVVNVLRRALEVTTEQYGRFELVSQDENTVQSRQIRNLKKGLTDIIWMISSTQRDHDALPIRIPVIGGLYGYRVLLVSQQYDTATRPDIATLRSLTYTQGPDWPDLGILRANQLNVKPSPYHSGFRLVREGFIDAYPRAAHEAVIELKRPVGEGLTLAPSILLTYHNPLFFYVANNNTALADRIKRGLSTLIESGELQQRLEAQPFYASALRVMRGRNVIELTNPYLSQQAMSAMHRYLKPNEALSYAAEIPDAATCKDDKLANQC